MNRRHFLSSAMGAVVAGSLAATPSSFANHAPSDGTKSIPESHVVHHGGLELDRHRFGVNYTPSKNWWFCWNDWDADSIKQDLDSITSLGADHLRILLIWPDFQPNPKWVSPLHLERLDRLLGLMEERNLDAVVTVFTGQLSGWYFLPPFNKPGSAFYADDAIWKAQEIFVRKLSRVVGQRNNLIGFDLGNEINTCWSTAPAVGDAWMTKMFSLMDVVCPGRVHVNGIDELPWFESNTFSPQSLASRPMPVMHCYPYLGWGAEVRRRDGSSQHQAARCHGNSDPVVCRRSSKASLGGGIQHLHRNSCRKATGGMAGESDNGGHCVRRELVQLLGQSRRGPEIRIQSSGIQPGLAH